MFVDTSSLMIYTLSLHDALPICNCLCPVLRSDSLPVAVDLGQVVPGAGHGPDLVAAVGEGQRSEEHTSELQSRGHLVCRLLLEKKNIRNTNSSYVVIYTVMILSS